MESPAILILSHEFPPLGGGAGKNLFLLCRELAQRGISVRVWTVDPGKRNRWPHEFAVEYITTSRKKRFETNLGSMAEFIFGACRLAFKYRKTKPDFMLANLAIPAGLVGWCLAGWYKSPLAVWHHGSDVHAGKPEGPGVLQQLLLRMVWSRSDMNFFVATGLREMAATLGKPKRPHILPACPSPEILAVSINDLDKTTIKNSGIKSDGRYFLFLGRFDPVKNPFLVLQAAHILKASGTVTYPVRMVGAGVLAQTVRDTITGESLSAYATCEAAAKHSQVPEMLRGAYALVVPSKIEGFSTTILEAAHFGVPAIASDTQGLREFVRHGETGLLFPEGDAAGLAESMQRLTADPAWRDSLGEAARANAKPYRAERLADSFLSGIASVVPVFGGYAGEAVSWN